MTASALLLPIILAQATLPTPTTCPDTPVRDIKSARFDIPADNRREQLEIHILVTVEPDASVKSVVRQDSSGNRAFDDAAMNSALNSTYAPATANCKPVEGTYLYLEMVDPF